MNIFIINLVTLITCDCFSTNHQNVTIFHRTHSDDIHNGHAKPSESEQQSSSAWRIINKKSESRSNKYFVTWRPDLWEEENKNNLSIISSHQHKHQDFQPQFYFSHKKQTQTSQPFFNESLTSLNAPPETSTARPPPTSTVWSYSPVFNTIFSVKPKYKPTFLPSTRATAAALRLKSTTTTVTTSTSTSTTTTTTTGTTTSSRRRTTSATIVQTEILKPFQSNLPLEDEETIVQSPTTFLAYIRFIIITVLRWAGSTISSSNGNYFRCEGLWLILWMGKWINTPAR